MQCAATIQAAPNGACSAGPRPRSMSAPSDPCELAASTSHGPKPDGSQSIIEKRAARLRHANQIRRARYIRLHQILSKREGRA